jgi:hypothetical protein
MARPALTFLLVACGACLSASLPGCGGASGPTGTINGKITINGAPAPTGTIVTFASQENARTGTVGSDGTFTVMAMPVGTYRVSFAPAPSESFSEDPKQAMMKAVENREKGVTEKPTDQIPAKYLSIETSGVSYEVKEGNNDFPLDLKE